MNNNLSENNRKNRKAKTRDTKNIKKDNIFKFINLLKQKNNETWKKNREERILRKKLNDAAKRKLKEEKREKIFSFINSLREQNRKKAESAIFLKEQAKKKRQQEIEQIKQKKLQILAETKQKKLQEQELNKKKEQETALIKQQQTEKKQQEIEKQKEQKKQIFLDVQKKRQERVRRLHAFINSLREQNRKKAESAIFLKEQAKKKRQQEIEQIKQKKLQIFAETKQKKLQEQELNKKKEQETALIKQQQAKKKQQEIEKQKEQKKQILLDVQKKRQERVRRLHAFINSLREQNRKKAESAIFLKEQARKKKQEAKENIILNGRIKEKILQLTGLTGTLQQNISQQVVSASNQISSIVKKAIKQPIPKIKKIEKSEQKKPVFSLFPLLKTKKSGVGSTLVLKKHTEPFMLVHFLRKNLFKIFVLILFLGILGEIGFYSATFKSPTQIFAKKYGPLIPSSSALKPKKPTKIKKRKPSLKISEVSIEGKRNPFSPGVLTMQVLQRPRFAGISLAYQPEVISIGEAPSPVISPSSVYKTPVNVSSILKSERPSLPSFISPESVPKPQISTLMVPSEIKNPFIYRGSMIINGIKYFFLEADGRTYRGAIGDTIKDFRIIKEQDNKIYLSKKGRIIEFSTQ